MKGLIYRELYLSKKSYIWGFLDFLIIFVMGMLVRLSVECGNIAKLETLDRDIFTSVDILTYYIFLYLPSAVIFFTMMTEHGIIIADLKSKWNMFSYTLPVSEEKTSLVKYIILVSSMLFGFIFSILNAFIICNISNRNFDSGIVKNILIIMTCLLIIQSLNIPLLIKLKSKAKSEIFFMLCFGILIFTVGKVIVENLIKKLRDDYNASEDETFEFINDFLQKIIDFRDKIFLLVPIVIIAVLVVGYFATVKILKGREK